MSLKPFKRLGLKEKLENRELERLTKKLKEDTKKLGSKKVELKKKKIESNVAAHSSLLKRWQKKNQPKIISPPQLLSLSIFLFAYFAYF